MMENRWCGTRARLQADVPAADAPELWGRIAASRRAGTSVGLPARDPRRPVRSVLALLLAVAVVLAGTTLRPADTRVTPEAPQDDPEASALLPFLPSPVQAQATEASTLPAIDPPDVSRLTPRMLVYQNERGGDGRPAESLGTDTISIARDTVEGLERIAVIHTGRGGSLSTLQAIDSLVLAGDGRFLFWRNEVKHFGTYRVTRVATTLRTDSVTFTFWRSGGRAVPPPLTLPANTGQYVRQLLLGMLPSLPFRDGYARSLSGLDLLRGTMTPGFERTLELRVVGKQWITVPAGRFHCWTVEFSVVYQPGDTPDRGQLWVDMESGSLVRAVWGTHADFEEQVLIEKHLWEHQGGE